MYAVICSSFEEVISPLASLRSVETTVIILIVLFLKCQKVFLNVNLISHTEHVFSFKFFFTWRNQITQGVWLWRRPSADPHPLVQFIQQRQRSNDFFQ